MADESPERWREAASLFSEAMKRPPDQRAGFVAEACTSDPELLRLVRQLMEADRDVGDFLDNPAISGADFLVRTLAFSTLRASDTIGPYRLLEKLGEGGMGEVWRAEQTQPIRRHVAVKVIKAGLDTKRVVARFEAERQALALMEHPAIAKVYDAGETPRGLPFFAMEYVPGVSITEYCDRQQLALKERLTLMASVCEGVQHAHQKGVIHRDLKPSNILVALQDGHPVPKIIDFGVAKAMGKRLTEHTLFTELGMIIGTPEYMSPEQAESTGLDVDTRTDVYALGVMLYQLMSGALPFEPNELRAAGYEELRRRIREVDPPRPSTRVARMGPESTEIARARRIEPRRLVSRLRGDLDWIAMKCLEKDRTRRYGSPADLAADLRRHLGNEPVLAGPPSTAYRARKFVRRHRIGVATVSVVAVALAVFAISTAAQARRIAAERDRADREAEVSRRVTEFMTNLFLVSDPSESRGNTVTAREILDRGASQIESELSAEPEVQARLMLTMGRVYTSLGLWRTAEFLDEKALALCRSVLGPEHPETLRAQYHLAMARFSLDRYDDAAELLERTADVQRRTLGAEHPETLQTLGSLATALVRLEHYDEAKQMYLDVLAVQRRTLGNEDRQTLVTLRNLGGLHSREEEWEDAERYLREAANTGRRALGEDHPETLQTLSSLAWVLAGTGKLQESEEMYRRVIAGKEKVYGLESAPAVDTMGSLASVLANAERYDEAETLFLKVIDFRRRQPGGLETSPSLTAMIQLGVAYMQMGRFDDSERVLSEAYEIAKRKMTPNHKSVYLSAFNLACLESMRGRHADAFHWLRLAVTNGFTNTDRIRDDPDLKPLHDDPEFERVLALAPGYEAPAVAATP